MQIKTSQIIREQVIALAKIMPIEKLSSWYEYGLFIQFHAKNISSLHDDQVDLRKEFEEWEAASDEDELMLENNGHALPGKTKNESYPLKADY